MIPRNELAELLQNRLGDRLARDEIQRISADVLALEQDWEEVDIPFSDMGYSLSVSCSDICWLAHQVERGGVFKILRKKIPGIA